MMQVILSCGNQLNDTDVRGPTYRKCIPAQRLGRSRCVHG